MAPADDVVIFGHVVANKEFLRNLCMYFADRNAPVTGTARNVATLIVAHLILALTFSLHKMS